MEHHFHERKVTFTYPRLGKMATEIVHFKSPYLMTKVGEICEKNVVLKRDDVLDEILKADSAALRRRQKVSLAIHNSFNVVIFHTQTHTFDSSFTLCL